MRKLSMGSTSCARAHPALQDAHPASSAAPQPQSQLHSEIVSQVPSAQSPRQVSPCMHVGDQEPGSPKAQLSSKRAAMRAAVWRTRIEKDSRVNTPDPVATSQNCRWAVAGWMVSETEMHEQETH
jgi:hypothetical protein